MAQISHRQRCTESHLCSHLHKGHIPAQNTDNEEQCSAGLSLVSHRKLSASLNHLRLAKYAQSHNVLLQPSKTHRQESNRR